MYDLIIIGAGPAGITASVYAARKRMNFILITDDIGGQAAWSGDVENYTGYQFISGPELAGKFEEHMRQYDIVVKEKEPIVELQKQGDIINVITKKSTYQSRAVIIASGKRSRELNVPGEKEFKNKGLTYCATCDGPLFAGKDVAVIGGGNSALDATLQLMNIAKRVYVVNNISSFSGDTVMCDKVKMNNKVVVLNDTKVLAVEGKKFVESLKIFKDGKEENIVVQGVFVEIGLIPNTDFALGVQKNNIGEIIVDSYNRTNLPGVFAAGDVTDIPEKQIIIAAGEGAKAVLSVFRYLAEHNFS